MIAKRLVCAVVLFLAMVVFWYRGPARTRNYVNDFAAPYVGSRLLLAGKNPYSAPLFASEWVQSGGRSTQLPVDSVTNTHPVYPLSTYVVLSPIALLPWKQAIELFQLIGILGIGVLAFQARRAVPANLGDQTCVVACLLVLAPFHSAFATGNISVLAVECLIASVLRPAGVGRGLLMGIALCLKPQLAIFPIVWWALQRDWKVVAVASGSFIAATLVAISRLGNLAWYGDLARNINLFVAPGSPNDPGPLNPSRFELINLQVIGCSAGLSYVWTNLLAWTVTLAIAIFLWLTQRDGDDLQGISAICILALLPVYSRYYNAGLVFLFVVCMLQQKRRVVALLALPFLVPLGAALRAFYGLPNSKTFAVFLYSGETWALIALIVALAARLSSGRRALAHPEKRQEPSVAREPQLMGFEPCSVSPSAEA